MIYFLKGDKFIEIDSATNSMTGNQFSIGKWAGGCPQIDAPTKSYYDNQQNHNTRRTNGETGIHNYDRMNQNAWNGYRPEATTYPSRNYDNWNGEHYDRRRAHEEVYRRHDNRGQEDYDRRRTYHDGSRWNGNGRTNNNDRHGYRSETATHSNRNYDDWKQENYDRRTYDNRDQDNHDRRRTNDEVNRRNNNGRTINGFRPETTTLLNPVHKNGQQEKYDRRRMNEVARGNDGPRNEKDNDDQEISREIAKDPTKETSHDVSSNDAQTYESTTTAILHNDSSAAAMNCKILFLPFIIFALWNRLN